MDSDEDWLDDAPAAHPGAHGDPLVDRQWERITTRYADAGYREGITEGKLSTLQQGFDTGFAESVAPSRRLGNLRGRIAGLIAHLQSLPSTTAHVDLLHRAREVRIVLSRVKRGDVLPRDEEALAHAREEHPDLPAEVSDGRVDAGGDWSVRAEDGERREMERMVDALEGMGGAANGGVREGQLLDDMEGKVLALEREAGL
ncbi:hypothetical protein QFC20_005538 [Naganishia adeliensis]|uniref:Uncharacterized protein n=1 Tax=Naganishia adeliensis TaxID=92952 RepID=A0ACC2VMY1_9TREE|nr:hypothetical protein QFC20_005538 [Naganishia adeliensis]